MPAGSVESYVLRTPYTFMYTYIVHMLRTQSNTPSGVQTRRIEATEALWPASQSVRSLGRRQRHAAAVANGKLQAHAETAPSDPRRVGARACAPGVSWLWPMGRRGGAARWPTSSPRRRPTLRAACLLVWPVRVAARLALPAAFLFSGPLALRSARYHLASCAENPSSAGQPASPTPPLRHQ